MRVTAQRSGYASTLFRYYERFFHDLGFNQSRLNASLSVGKYYWAKEGFDFTSCGLGVVPAPTTRASRPSASTGSE
jgi:hypothetical protein